MPTPKLLSAYQPSPSTWDEMLLDGNIRQQYQIFFESLRKSSITDLARKDELAKKLFMSQGITFTVYSDGE
ncbi:MAG: circularly permuted type 2 ATP-grasp protein, partial [Bacteroidota bacterium]